MAIYTSQVIINNDLTRNSTNVEDSLVVVAKSSNESSYHFNMRDFDKHSMMFYLYKTKLFS